VCGGGLLLRAVSVENQGGVQYVMLMRIHQQPLLVRLFVCWL
jgi:hypothetical protein